MLCNVIPSRRSEDIALIRMWQSLGHTDLDFSPPNLISPSLSQSECFCEVLGKKTFRFSKGKLYMVECVGNYF